MGVVSMIEKEIALADAFESKLMEKCISPSVYTRLSEGYKLYQEIMGLSELCNLMIRNLEEKQKQLRISAGETK